MRTAAEGFARSNPTHGANVISLAPPQITCPGVLLKDKSELYLSACVFGQYKRTQCVPAAFPLFLEEKLVFEKVFTDVVDPGELVELLELGEILATYEENTRDFLFPDPKLTRGHHGSDREVLMKRSSSFTIYKLNQKGAEVDLQEKERLNIRAPLLMFILGVPPETVDEKLGPGYLMILLYLAAIDPSILKFNTGWSTPANGEEIHKRVKNILRTHSARQRLTFGMATFADVGRYELNQPSGSAVGKRCSVFT
ncbi:Spermatogenesis-associated protein 6 [Chelonia mydas]|uniref:Spermatogenesis-associated protein 6 n=1 Tax=Chelonia mydas TaxID=8469 RepID=M7BAD8_CHEMY|nr:Spermatogenesis-associated protein 6 [Chelonia mydas]